MKKLERPDKYVPTNAEAGSERHEYMMFGLVGTAKQYINLMARPDIMILMIQSIWANTILHRFLHKADGTSSV